MTKDQRKELQGRGASRRVLQNGQGQCPSEPWAAQHPGVAHRAEELYTTSARCLELLWQSAVSPVCLPRRNPERALVSHCCCHKDYI